MNDLRQATKKDYKYLSGMEAEAWAWEFIRRSAAYRAAWEKNSSSKKNTKTRTQKIVKIDTKEAKAAASFGLLFFRKPGTGLGICPAFLVTPI